MAEAAIAAADETDVLARDRRVDSRSSRDVGFFAGPSHQEVDVFAEHSRLEYMDLPGAGRLRTAGPSRVGQEDKYWIPADISDTQGTLEEGLYIATNYSTPPILGALSPRSMVYIVSLQTEPTVFSEEAETIEAELDRYFALRGLEQREFRSRLLAFVMNTSTRKENAIDYTLGAVRQHRSEDTMAAAMDLMTEGGASFARSALDRALARYANEADDDVLYAPAIAVGRTDHEALFNDLVQSSAVALREAAVELLASDPSDKSKEQLRHLANADSSELIQGLAEEALRDLER